MAKTALFDVPSACKRSAAMPRKASAGGAGSLAVTSGGSPEGMKRCWMSIVATFSWIGGR